MDQGSMTVNATNSSATSTSDGPVLEIGRRIPFPLIAFAGSTYASLAKLFGKNRFKYHWNDHTFEFEFSDIHSLVYLYRAIENGHTRHEKLPLELFDVSPEFDAIIDIGAHFGTYSVILGTLNPTCPVYAFEPNAENATVLRNNLSINGIDGKVIEKAVSDHTGTIELFEHPDAHNVHTTVKPTDSSKYSQRSIQSTTVSGIFDQKSITDAFLKIDAEGAEDRIITDLIENANNGHISGLLELHPNRMDTDWRTVLNALSDAGFTYTLVKDIANTPGYYFTNFESRPEKDLSMLTEELAA